ncbi:MAG TPA: hypothetical protein VGC40_11830 [Paenirhodobacter sp.]
MSPDAPVVARPMDRLAYWPRGLSAGYVPGLHDLAVVSAIANDIVVLGAGRVVESGLIQAVFRWLGAAHPRRLLAAIPGGRG